MTSASTMDVPNNYKRQRRIAPPPPKRKMEAFFPSPIYTETVPCSGTDCYNLPAIECMDEECQKFMEEYCQACFEGEFCESDGCAVQCDECCDTTCLEGECSTQVFISFGSELIDPLR